MKKAERKTKYWIRPGLAAFFILITLGLVGNARGQADALFETTSLEVRLTWQLKLTPKDLRSIRPLMEWEIDDLLLLYAFYRDQNDPDFLSLWNAVRSRQVEFANRPTGKLTRRQEKALLLARLEFQTRILDQWLDDHLQMLNDILELDLVQFKYVQKVFDVEQRERVDILRKEGGGPVHLDALWQKLGDQREGKLEQILSGSQLRTYRQMKIPPRLIAVDHQIKVDQ